MLTYFKIAARNLWRQKKRSALLAAAIISGLTLIILAGAFADGAGRNIIRMGTTLRTGHINVTGLLKERKTVFQEIPDSRQVIERITKTLPGITRIEKRITLMATTFNPGRELGARRAFVYGVDFRSEKNLRTDLVITAGDWTELDKPGRVLIFKRTAEKLDLKVGDTLSLSAQVRNTRFGNTMGTLDLRVAAIAADTQGGQMENVYLAREELARFLGFADDAAGTLLIYLRDRSGIEGKEEQLRTALSAIRPVNPKQKNPLLTHIMGESVPGWEGGHRFQTANYEEILQNEMLIKRGIDLVSWLLLVILVVIVFAGISNSLWMAIRERTKEVGTLRAIGMGRRQILTMFLSEGILLGGSAALLGVLCGAAAAGLLDLVGIGTGSSMFALFSYRGHLSFLIDPAGSLRLVLFTVFVTAAASLLPAAKAARMRPISAINHIG